MTHITILLIACLIPFALYGVFRAIDRWNNQQPVDSDAAKEEG